MKNIALVSVILTLATGLCFADTSDDTLEFYLGKSDLVVIGEITTVSGPSIKNLGAVVLLCEFRIADVLKGDISLKGKTIGVNVIRRIEMNEKDNHPLLKKDSECILFLKKVGTKENPAWQTVDVWFAIQYPSPSMARSLKRLAKDISYPYKASRQRESQILEGAPKITPGVKSARVKAILGEPDELTDLFRRSDIENKPRGYSYWYMIQREAPLQTMPKDPSQKLVRVCFDLNDEVTSVDYWGINNPSDDKLDDIDPPEIEGRGEWGAETMGLDCRITTDKTEYTIGDRVFILVEVRNNSDKPIALGLEPLIADGDGNLSRRPANIGFGFTQENKQGRLGFNIGGGKSFPRGTESAAKAISLAPGKTYSEVFAREPWGPAFGCLPSTAQPGIMALRVTVRQFLAGDLKKTQVHSNKLELEVKAKEEDSDKGSEG